MKEIEEELSLTIKYDSENLEDKIVFLLEKYELDNELQSLFFMIIDKGIEVLLNE